MTRRVAPPGTPRWGAAWKKAAAENYLSSYQVVTHGSCYTYRDVYCDLDPTYTDRLGRKLMRITFDFHENELKMSQYLTDRLAEIAPLRRALEDDPAVAAEWEAALAEATPSE